MCAWAESYEYDELNRVTKVMYDDGSYVEYRYDAAGNIISVNVFEAEKTTKPEKEEESTKTTDTKVPSETGKSDGEDNGKDSGTDQTGKSTDQTEKNTDKTEKGTDKAEKGTDKADANKSSRRDDGTGNLREGSPV